MHLENKFELLVGLTTTHTLINYGINGSDKFYSREVKSSLSSNDVQTPSRSMVSIIIATIQGEIFSDIEGQTLQDLPQKLAVL